MINLGGNVIFRYGLPLSIFFLILLLTPDGRANEKPNLSLVNLQLGAGVGFQGGGSSYTGFGRLVPEYRFDPKSAEGLGVGLDLGVTGFNNAGQSNFAVIEYAGYGAYHFDENWDFRLFAGAQTWTDGQGTAFMLGPQVLYHFGIEPGPLFLDGIVASYNAVFHSNFASLIDLGVTFKFD